MPLTPTEVEFFKDLRHIEKQFEEAHDDAKKQLYSDRAMWTWRAISILYREKLKRRNPLDMREKGSYGHGNQS